MATKTDNHNARAKLALRRHFLASYHKATPPDVADCFAGYGRLWDLLRKEFTLAAYTPIELRKIPARLRMDSLEYLRRGDWSHDVLDLDAYGSPWKHFFAVLTRITRPSTIFLTVGCTGMGLQDRFALAAAGITFKVPSAMHRGLADRLISSCLAAPIARGLRIMEAQEAPNPGGDARYLGLHLVPASSQTSPPARSRRRSRSAAKK